MRTKGVHLFSNRDILTLHWGPAVDAFFNCAAPTKPHEAAQRPAAYLEAAKPQPRPAAAIGPSCRRHTQATCTALICNVK